MERLWSKKYRKLVLDAELFLDGTEALTDAETGRLIKALALYSTTGERPDTEGNERFILPYFIQMVDAYSPKSTAGSNHPNWKGGVTPRNRIDRNSAEYKAWRTKVFERDDYTCQLCGEHGGKLNAHHVVPFAKDKAKRLEVSNGVTLCEDCHRAIHRGDLELGR